MSDASSLALPDQPSPVESCREARRILDVLAHGTIGDVWEILEAGALPDLDAIGDVGDDWFAACRDTLLDKLTEVLSRTDDDRIVARILEEIDFEEMPALMPALRAALGHDSPDVRRRALRAVTTAADPLLAAEVEARFELERDERVRREVIRALAATNSRRYLAELRGLAQREDAPLRHVALQAVLDLPDATSIPLLAGLASSPSDGDVESAGRIASALSLWDDVPGIDDALVRIGRDGPEQAASESITGLARRGVGALGALAAIANGRERTGEPVLAEQARATIRFLQSDSEEETNSITITCDGGGGGGRARSLPLASGDAAEFSDSPLMIVNPADRSDTARCWDAPGFMWPEEIRPRVPAGTELTHFDEFFWGDESWLAVLSVEHICWMREDDIAAEVADGEVRRGVGAYEFDVPIAEIQSWAIGNLERRGWLTVLSADESVAALRLAIEEPTRSSVAALIEIRSKTDAGILVAAIDQWLWLHGSAWRDDDEFGGAIPTKNPRWK